MVGRRECLPFSYGKKSTYNRCREGNVSRKKGMSSTREGYTYHGDIRIDVQEIFFDSRYRRYYRLPVFASPRLQPLPRPVIQSITSSRSSSQSRLRYSVAVSRYPCPVSFAGAQPLKGELLSWCNLDSYLDPDGIQTSTARPA